MSERSRKPNYGWWETQIKAGIKYREKVAKQHKWDDWRAYYRGEWRPGIMPINYFFSILRALVPRVYFKNPGISVTPAMPGLMNAVFAQIQERIDNKLIKSMKVKKHIKRMVQDAFLFGTAFGKLGFGAVHTPSPNSIITSAPVSQTWGAVEYKAGIMPNMPWFSRVHPGKIIVPDMCEDMDEARWVAHEVERPLLDVKDDTRFKNRSKIKSYRASITKYFGLRNEPIEMCKLWEVRDKKHQQVYVLGADQEVNLYDGVDELQTSQGFPIYEVVFNDDDEYFWGVPDSMIIEPQQLEANETRTQIMMHRRLTLIKLMYEEGSIDDAELAKMVSEDVMAAVKVKEIGKQILTQSGTIPKELYLNSDMIAGDIREQVGFSRNQMADLQQKKSERTTATEASIVQMASEIRVDERQDILADMLERVVHSMHQVIHKFWQAPQIIDLVGPAGIPVWVEFSGKMLEGGAYEVNIDADSLMPQTRQAREAKAVQAYQLFKDNPMIDPIKLTKNTLRELYGVQYDDMMRGLPQGAGITQPMNVGQFAQLQNNANRLGLPQSNQTQGAQ
jgi:hypothetical protein